VNDKVCSEKHAKRLRKLHARDPNFGVIGHLWAEKIAMLMRDGQCETILDYGCGRSDLVPAVVVALHAMNMPCVKRQEYDPATAPGTPEPADFVSCIDVLEHVEVDKLDAVLSHIHKLMRKSGIITVSLRNGSLANRKTHPLVRPREWWIEKLHERFYVDEISPLDPAKAKSELAVLVEPIR